jgi:hypothetical protein
MDSDLIPKKRGRPRKSAESNQTGQTESTAAVTRRTSTTSTRKVATAKAKPTKSKSTQATKSGAAVLDSHGASSKPVEATEDANVPAPKKQITTSSAVEGQVNNQGNSKEVLSVSSPKATASSPASSRKHSRILQKLAAKDVASPEKTPALETAPETARTASEASEEIPSLSTKPSSNPQPSNIAPTKFSPSAHARVQSADPNGPPSLKQMNAYAVNSLSQHAHPSRPPPKIGQTKANIGPKYRSVARRVTTLMVALPIVCVTSWVLYDRRE